MREQLRAKRKEVGLTQAELSARLDKSQHYVSRTELGDHRLDIVQLEEYCGALGLDMMEFWTQLSLPPTDSPPLDLNTQTRTITSVGASAVRLVERAKELLEEDCLDSTAEPLTTEQVAARLGWSTDHLRRMMRAVCGQTPVQIQIAARLRHAQTLLLDRDLSISKIALACGFATSSHFAQAFKSANGCSPREFRFKNFR